MQTDLQLSDAFQGYTTSHVTLYTSTTHNTVSLQTPGTLLQRDSELIHNSKRFYKDS